MSQMIRPHLSNLPEEIIHHIAAYLPFESILNLRETSRSLRQACNDWSVFCRFSECNAGYEDSVVQCCCGQTLTPSRILAWTGFQLTLSSPLLGRQSMSSDMFIPVTNWLPALLAQHHPLLLSADIKPLLDQFDRTNPVEEQTFLFCVLIHLWSPKNSSEDILEQIDSIIYDRYGIAQEGGILATKLSQLEALADMVTDENMWPIIQLQRRDIISLHITAYTALIALSADLRSLLVGRTTFPWAHRQPPHKLPPASVDIPFLRLLKIPSYNSHDFLSIFNTCHIPRMASSQFLEIGSWCGSINREPMSLPRENRLDLYTPIRDLRFRIKNSRVDPDALVLKSTVQRNAYEDFIFFGRIRKDTGVLVMVQEYVAGPVQIHWQGIMTPFGILGTYLRPKGSKPGPEWIWLWKDNSPALTFAPQPQELN